ncbi:MAG: DUF4389 domain-containing protein [Hylemonella sp.]|nr:DUF4389 domain-containing protein [Hylemonella sp.]MDH5707851.1 DUF4389 domain-containing protein [Hylemonella sp.]
MTDLPGSEEKRTLWLRVLLMVLIALAFHLGATVLLVVAIVQLILTIVSSGPNERLQKFGGSLGEYLRQCADFLCFTAEEAPFPFNDWPKRD